MSGLDDIKEAFQGKRGKVLLIGGGLAVAAYVWYVRSHPTTPTTDDTTTTTDGLVSSGTGSGGTSPQSDPTVGNSSTGTATTSRPTTNAGWLSDATDFLAGRGVPSGDAYSALSKALDGQQITDKERAWVSQAITAVGTPPDGMPPLQSAPTTTTTTPAAALTAPTNLRVTATYTNGFGLAWSGVNGADGYLVSVNGKAMIRPYTAGTTVYGLAPKTKYTITVSAQTKSGTAGPAASTSGTTKAK